MDLEEEYEGLSFLVEENGTILYFQHIEEVKKHERKILVKQFMRWDNLKSQFGFWPSLAVKTASLFFSVKYMYNAISSVEMSKGPSFIYFIWKPNQIDDRIEGYDYIGMMCLSYQSETHHNISLILHPMFRGRGLTTGFMDKVLGKFRQLSKKYEYSFPKRLLIRFRPEHTSVQKIMDRLGEDAVFLYEEGENMNFWLFNKMIKLKYYEVDLVSPPVMIR
jgi:hypothetical protein